MTRNPPPNGRKVTIRDVASLANVSISTVSHVFSGSRPISEKTKERVRNAAAQLNYQPDPSARSLRSSKAGIIGLILRPKDAIHGTLRGTETFQSLLSSIATHALEHGRGLIHVPDVLDSSATSVAMDACIVAHPCFDDKVVAELRSRGTPVVMIDADPVHADVPWVVNIDFRTATVEMLEAMRGEGRKRITYISGTESNSWNRISTAAYEEWCLAHGFPPEHIAVYEGTGMQGALDTAHRLLSRENPPDAILTGPSTFARGVLEVATSLGVDVPGQLAIAALTDSELTRTSTPPVTSLELRMDQAGAEAVRLALRLADGGDPPGEPLTVQPEIMWRESLPRPR
ncbi:LacI family DNA-binding transcriptional regulator [Leucobacter celer]|uniref:LacI family DNA-binding transcriptional regulator n=1 Tax=Leucobacter celer TaxID=668625 RepID=UPI0006A7AE8A|nr:LacI family DNA-binding transcriptional regulator [Leucobacter celer]